MQECPPGVYACAIQPGSSSEKAHLHETIITQVNGQAVHTPAEFYRLTLKSAGPLELTILEHGQVKTIKLD
jgi:S1-C subfamily serine protease